MKQKSFKVLVKIIAVICVLLLLASCSKLPAENSYLESEIQIIVTEESSSEISSKEEPPKPAASSRPTPAPAVPSSSTPSPAASEETTAESSNIEVVNKYGVGIYFGDADFSREIFNDSLSGKTMPYRLHIPDNFDPQKKYPVILFLHGAGEIGSDNESHLKNFAQSFEVAGDILGQCIIVCPQTPAGWSINDGDSYDPANHNGYLAVAKRILDEQISKYSGDPARVYLTGLSLGSFANWTMLEAYPNFFAAAVPVCGGTGGYVAPEYLTVPLWLYHGTHDTIVGYESSNRTYEEIRNAGGKVKLTTLQGVDHNAWDYAYTDREMFSWMMSQNRLGNQSMNYESINLTEIVSSDGTTVFNEQDITNSTFFVDTAGNYIELYISEKASSALKKAFNRNKSQVFTFKFCEQSVYDFKLKEFKDEGILRLENTVDEATFKRFNRIIQRYAIKVSQRGS